MLRTNVFLWFALCLGGPVYAQTCEPPSFGNKDQIAATLQRVEDDLLKGIGRIETVPPSEAKYIEDELKTALGDSSRIRFAIIAAHRLYHPYQVQIHFKAVLDELNAAREESGLGNRVVYLATAISRMVDLSGAVAGYIDFDNRRRPRVLSRSDVQDLSSTLTAQRRLILQALQCSVQGMEER